MNDHLRSLTASVMLTSALLSTYPTSPRAYASADAGPSIAIARAMESIGGMSGAGLQKVVLQPSPATLMSPHIYAEIQQRTLEVGTVLAIPIQAARPFSLNEDVVRGQFLSVGFTSVDANGNKHIQFFMRTTNPTDGVCFMHLIGAPFQAFERGVYITHLDAVTMTILSSVFLPMSGYRDPAVPAQQVPENVAMALAKLDAGLFEAKVDELRRLPARVASNTARP